MTRLPDEFHEDRALREAAREVLLADIEHARGSLSGKAVAKRVTGGISGRIADGAKDVYEVAKGHAYDQRGILAILIALLAVWFAREPIMEVLGLAEPTDADGDEPPEEVEAEEAEEPETGVETDSDERAALDAQPEEPDNRAAYTHEPTHETAQEPPQDQTPEPRQLSPNAGEPIEPEDLTAGETR
ncbi:MAG: hypothetical protein QNI87_03295 [Erythrobacter sp.]|uniref:hypothetical protein n=1 Tax=Erythrobacter sp. TaxID=1042 RepID=UPI002622C642|nr:hypothetical protein [Erythrobacter sp.]MDJ0977537.1 hypothetical protein [Erythrobacter sp.]